MEGRLGRLRVRHRVEGELLFHFTATEEMRKAVEMLPEVLGDRLAVNVVLDRARMRYVSKY